jgi:hypothetical protein
MTETPARYRQRPIEADAIQWTGSNADALRAFAGIDFDTIDPEDRIEDPDQDAQLLVEASHWVGIRPGDWVLKFEGYFVAKSDVPFRAVWEPAAPTAVPSAPTVRAALRDRIADTLAAADGWRWVSDSDKARSSSYRGYQTRADAVLSVLPATTDRADAEAPLSPDYEHPGCGFHWHGRDGMDIPMRDGQPVCPRCELKAVGTRLHYSEQRREELRTESKRRGKKVLEQSERIRALEREIDGVRRQLGEEIVRTGQAEFDPSRMAGEAQQPETEAQPPRHRWYIEILDGVAGEWAPGMRSIDRADAAERYRAVSERYPTWKDGTPVQRRFVRETTSYTVEAEPAVGAQQPKEA